MNGERTPDFLIVGAPKCGTTFLDGVLSEHPQIHQAKKELHYFGSDLRFMQPRISLAGYLRHFQAAEPGQICGEASVWYLYSHRAAKEISAFNDSARIIVLLRDPVDMVESLHAQLLFRGNETIRDLRSALAAEPRRRAGMDVPPRCSFPDGLQYREVVDLAPQVQRYLDRFGRAAVHIVLFDDLKTQPENTVADVLRFLGLHDHPGWSREKRNARHAVRSVWLQRLVHRPPAVVKRLTRSVLPEGARRRAGGMAARTLRRVNQGPVPEPDPGLRQFLRQELRPQVEALENVVGRSLSSWQAM